MEPFAENSGLLLQSARKMGGARGTGELFTLLKKWLERVTGQRYTIIVIVCPLARLERTADSNICEDENEVQQPTYG